MLIDNPLVVLFVVVALGAAVGSIRVKGISLGPAGALFVGLAVSAFDDRLGNTPAIVPQIGLALFIYTVGLASGPSFLAGLRHGGVRILALAGGVIATVAGLVLAAGAVLDLDVGARSGGDADPGPRHECYRQRAARPSDRCRSGHNEGRCRRPPARS